MNNEEKVERWNFYYISGTDVQLTNDDGQIEETKTRSRAWLLGSGTPVVKVEGRSGGYLLDRVRPVHAYSPEDITKDIYPTKVKETARCISCGQTFSRVIEYIGPCSVVSLEQDKYVSDREAHAEICPGFCGMGISWSSL